MKSAYSGIALFAIFAASAFCAVGSALLSVRTADALVPVAQPHDTQVIRAPSLDEARVRHPREATVHRPTRVLVRAPSVKDLERSIIIREQEIKRLEEEIRMIEERIKVMLHAKIDRIHEEIAFLKRNRLPETAAVNPDDLSFGDHGPRVRSLQEFLNRNGFALAASGPGSDGEETDYFGPLTLRALRLFQGAQTVPITGMLDAATRLAVATIEDSADEPEWDGEEEESQHTLVSFLKHFFRSIFGGEESEQA